MSLEEYVFSCGASIPLFVEGAKPFNIYLSGTPINDEIPLYSVGVQGASNSLKLFVKGAGFPAYSSGLPLVCYNDTIIGSLSLYVSGEGVTPGALPINNSLLLYIQCGFGAMLPMYVMGGPQPQGTGSIDFFTMGFIDSYADLPLSIPNVYDTKTNSVNLYTHGY